MQVVGYMMMMDELPAHPIFLVGDVEGSLGGLEEGREGGVVRDGVVFGVPESDVADAELGGASLGVLASGVFANPQQEVESYGA